MANPAREVAQPMLERPLAPAIVIVAAAAICFFHLGSYGLWEPDEARYAEIAREMVETGDFIVPHLNYVAYVEKPPLLYWLTSFWFEIFGADALAARITPALSALGCVAATYLFAATAFDRKRATLAAAILATSPLFAIMAQVLTTDTLLTLWITIAAFAFFLHWKKGGRWRWVFYAAMGLGVLTKGPVAAVIPALSASIFLWARGDWREGLRKLSVISGLALTSAIAAPWFVAVSIHQPDFFSFYFIGEHLRRVFEPSFSHGEPIYFYLPVIIGGMLPWSILMPLIATKGKPAATYCLIAAATTIGLFSLASGKLIPYVLPALPPLAILIADGTIEYVERDGLRTARRLGAVAILPVAAGIGLIGFLSHNRQALEGYLLLGRASLTALAAILLVGGGAALVTSRRSGEACLVSIAVMTAAVLVAASYARIAIEPMRSYDALSRQVARKQPRAVLISYGKYVQVLPFYAQRRVILFGNPSELRFGAEHDPDAGQFFLVNDAALISLWKNESRAVLVIDERDLQRLAPELGAYELVAAEHHKLAVLNSANRSRR
jgi:4-amino-4-deoxy-L-arabinose transferase-like glycosyltransferase